MKNCIITYEYVCGLIVGIFEAIIVSNNILNRNNNDCYYIMDLVLTASVINIGVPFLVTICLIRLCFTTVSYYRNFCDRFGDFLLKLWLFSQTLLCALEIIIAIMVSCINNSCYNYPQPDQYHVRGGSIALRYGLIIIQIVCILLMLTYLPIFNNNICKKKKLQQPLN